MTDQTQPQGPPPPPPPPPARPKPFFETTLGALVIVAVVILGIFGLIYVTQYAGGDDSVTVDCVYDDDSASCTRY